MDQPHPGLRTLLLMKGLTAQARKNIHVEQQSIKEGKKV